MERGLFIALAFLASSAARGGASLAGMGGVGYGIANPVGDISENPAASSAGLRRSEGALCAGGAFQKLAFAGRAYNDKETTTADFGGAEGLAWSFISPTVGPGRVGAGSWQVERRSLRLAEDLDLSLPDWPGGPPLSGEYLEGVSRIRGEEGLWAHGAVWIAELANGAHRVSAGAAYLAYTERALLEVSAVREADEEVVELRHISRRRDMAGPGFLFGYYFEPRPGGGAGVSLMYAAAMRGKVWECTDGGPLWADKVTRDPQLRAGVGAHFTAFRDLICALDVRYVGETGTKKTLYKDTLAERKFEEKGNSSLSLAVGTEYRMRFSGYEIPLRTGVFTRQDPLPSPVKVAPISSVKGLMPAAFRQDVTGFTAGSGWEREGLRADLALSWLMVNTRVKYADSSGTVESGDVRNGWGATLGVSMRFGRWGTGE